MPNIVSVTGRLNAPALRDLLSLSIGYPTAEKIERICRQHVEDRRRDVIGYEDGNAVLGMLGYQQTALYAAVITHLTVDPAWQRRGIARSLLAYLIEAQSFTSIELETHAGAVPFYVRCGFSVESLGEVYPGVERFRCQRTL